MAAVFWSTIEGLAQGFLDALRFLTRLPVPLATPAPPVPENLDATGTVYAPHPWVMGLFPAVGLLLGGLLLTVSVGLGWLLPETVVNLILLGVLVVLTGAIHWDGLMDSADALGVARARRAEVMKDVHAGSFAVLAVVFVVALQWGALGALSGWSHGAALLLFPVWGRWTMVALCWNMDDLRRGRGLAAAFLSRLSGAQLGWASGFALLGSVLLLGLFRGLVLALVMGLLALVLRWAVRRLFGGVSGDPIGAACVLGETVALVTVSALV